MALNPRSGVFCSGTSLTPRSAPAPGEQYLVVGTYGPGIWLTNIAPLQEMTAELLAKDVHLFEVRPAALRTESGWGNYQLYGDRHLWTPNEPNGFVVTYYLKEKATAKVSVAIADPFGKELHTAAGPGEAGLNRFVWEPRQPVAVGAAFRRPADRPAEAGRYEERTDDA